MRKKMIENWIVNALTKIPYVFYAQFRTEIEQAFGLKKCEKHQENQECKDCDEQEMLRNDIDDALIALARSGRVIANTQGNDEIVCLIETLEKERQMVEQYLGEKK